MILPVIQVSRLFIEIILLYSVFHSQDNKISLQTNKQTISGAVIIFWLKQKDISAPLPNIPVSSASGLNFSVAPWPWQSSAIKRLWLQESSMNNRPWGWYPQPYYKYYAHLLHGLYPLANKRGEDLNNRRPITLKGLLAPRYNHTGPFAVPHFANTFYSSLDQETSRVHSYTDLQLQWTKFQTRGYAEKMGWREDPPTRNQWFK